LTHAHKDLALACDMAKEAGTGSFIFSPSKIFNASFGEII